MFAELDAADKRHLSDLRRGGRGIFRFGNHDDDPSTLGEDIALWAQIWLDLYYTYHFLLDAEPLHNLGWGVGDAVNGGLADAWLHLTMKNGPGLPYPGNDAARSCIVDEPTASAFRGCPITTRCLLECASSLDELRVLSHSIVRDNAPDLQRMAVMALAGTDYGLPVRAALETNHPPSMNTVLALIDFALNPPIPGISFGEGRMAWAELYPPQRFELALLFRDPQFDISPDPTSDELLHYRRSLEVQTGLRYGVVAHPLSSSHSLSAVLDDLDQGRCGVRGVLLYIASTMLAYRDNDPGLISHFGAVFQGDEAVRMLDYHEWNDVLLPFVEDRGGKFSYAAHLDERSALAFASQVAGAAATDDVVNGVGPLTLDHLPRDFGQRFGDQLAYEISQRFGVEVSAAL
ncbi:MAG: hypothetical protein JO246_10810 [Frankiaceae bacterium]|nr:hypothetical protein [Frankiaceae bacterium]MBV9871286.1 hypothetical protein [Frankiaceae bacterium]